jgi:hypothetical protein
LIIRRIISAKRIINFRSPKERKMGGKIKSIHNGKMRVGIPEGQKVYVYAKKFPDSLKKSKDYKKYDWLGNFGFKKKSNDKKVTGKFDKSYEIQVEDRPNKKLVYWNGKKKKTVKFSGKNVKNINKVKYRIAKLRMGDPPIGWAL